MKVHQEIKDRLAQSFPVAYEKCLHENQISDNGMIRKVWTSAFNFGFKNAQQWIPVDVSPIRNDFYLVTTEQEHHRMGRTRVGYFRDGQWLWYVEEGVLEIFGVVAWQPLPKAYNDKPEFDPNNKSFIGFGTTVKKLGKFLKDFAIIQGILADERTWRIRSLGEGWLFEMEELSFETLSLIQGFRWLVRANHQTRRDLKLATDNSRDSDDE